MSQVNPPGRQGEEQPTAQVVENFAGINTKASRPGIGNEEFAWLQNFMPIGPQNLRTMYDKGATLYTAPNPLQDTIVFTYAFNIGSTSYQAVFLSNGTAYQVNRATQAITTISATPNTFYVAGGALPHCAQWQSKFLVIVTTAQDNGYWLWNGSSLFGAGTLSPEVVVTGLGSGYTSAPTVTAYGGSGSGATFSATVDNGEVVSVAMTAPGSAYTLGDEVTLAFSGGGSDSGAAATATVTTTSGGITSVIVTSGGSGYSSDAAVTFTGGGGSGAQAIISSATAGGIQSITVINPGTGYTSAPTVGITASTGSGFAGAATIRTGQVTSGSVVAGGSGYDAPPLVSIIGDGVGATAVCTIAAGAVNAITITNGGFGYTKAAFTFSGNNNAATATVTLMPFGVQGDSVETYQSRVWVSNVTTGSFTAPASPSDFATSSGGGSFAATESFLRRQITRLIQSSGFLYQIADSSINVISNVQTTGDPPTTTFNNANIDPQVGCPWRDTIQAFGRALVFANSSGVYALYGGAAEKVSPPLDGLFANATFNTGAAGGVTPTAGVATIFGIRCYCLSFTTINPYTEAQQTIMACWDGRNWFCATQSTQPTFVATEEIDSELTVWGNDGTILFPLFQEPSDTLQKVFQTKLRSDPALFFYKKVNRFYMMAESLIGEPPIVQIGIDTERGNGALTSYTIGGAAIQWVNDSGGLIQFTGSGGAAIYFVSSGLAVYGADRSDTGRLIGITGVTTSADSRVLSLTVLMQSQYALFG